jgi:hypothetical protein
VFTSIGAANRIDASILSPGLKTTGVDSTTVTVVIKDVNGYTVDTASNVISLSVTGPAVLSGSAINAVNGTGTIQLTSIKSSGTIVVTATAAGLSTATVTVFNDATNVPSQLDLQPAKTAIIADGRDTTVITCTVKDVFGNTVTGVPVQLNLASNNLATVIGGTTVDISTGTGRGIVIVQSTITAGTVVVSAYSSVIAVTTVTLTAIAQLPVRVACTVGADNIYADGITVTTITARIADVNNNTVITSSYTTVFFNVAGEAVFAGDYNTTTNGLIYVSVQNGVGTILLRSTSKTGTAMITAEAPGLIPGTMSVVTISSTAVKILLVASNNKLLADGDDAVYITAKIVDSNNNPVIAATNTVTFIVYHAGQQRQLAAVQSYEAPCVNGSVDYGYSDIIAGKMSVVATADGLVSGTIEINNMLDKFTGGYYLFDDTGTRLYFPAWSINNDVTVSISTSVQLTGINTGIKTAGVTTREFMLRDVNGNAVTGMFNRPVTVTLSYKDDDNDGIIDGTDVPVDKLQMFTAQNTGSNLEWVRTSVLNKQDRTVTATVQHFSVFTLGIFVSNENKLYQNYPNPFNPGRDITTRIEYSVQDVIPVQTGIQLTRVSVKVYNIAGELVRTLADKDVLAGVKGYADWDGKNDDGVFVADGVYLCQLVTPSYKSIIKVLLVK